jgi:surfeit locus 1 family protein
MVQMAATKTRPRFALLPLIVVVIGVVILLGLGVWQVQRLQWKTRLLARIAALQTAPPEPLGVVLNRIPDHVDVDFTHVVFTCPTLQQTPFQRIYSVTDEGVGDRIVTACPLPPGGLYRSILVDRGYVSSDDVGKLTPGSLVDGPIVGVLRQGSGPNALTPKHQGGGEWFSRDAPRIAAALSAPDPAPVFVMVQSPEPRGFGPTPMPIPADIPNNHLGYAITWFGLAVALIGFYIATLLRPRP